MYNIVYSINLKIHKFGLIKFFFFQITITFETNCTISFEQEKRQAKTTNDIICNHYHYDNQSR